MSVLPPSLARPALSDNAIGALWMLASAVCFTVMAACLKLLAQAGYSEGQMVFARCAAGLVAIIPFVLRAGAGGLKVARPRVVLLRSLYSTLGFFAGFYSFAHLPLADAQAITFTRVLFVVILAAWLLKEPVAWRRWTAVGVGFAGAVIMLRPEASGIGLAALLGLVSAFLFGLAIVTVKDLTRDHSTLALVFYTNAFTTIAGLPFAFIGPGWIMPTLPDFALLMLLGFSGIGAQSAYVRALSRGDASLMGLIDYARLPLAIVMGLFLFQELPDPLAMLGAGVVIGSTVYITWRESRLQAKPPPEGG